MREVVWKIMHMGGDKVAACDTVVRTVALLYSLSAGVHLWAAQRRAREHVTSLPISLVLGRRREQNWTRCMNRPILDGFMRHQIPGLQTPSIGSTLLERDVESIGSIWTYMSSVSVCMLIPRCIYCSSLSSGQQEANIAIGSSLKQMQGMCAVQDQRICPSCIEVVESRRVSLSKLDLVD
jgi:hypothetical protein